MRRKRIDVIDPDRGTRPQELNTHGARDAHGEERRILVVDDDAVFRELVVAVLELEGCIVEGAEDGPEGVEKALAYDYDLILMDNRLPGYRADEAVRRVMAQKPKQRIVVVTGSPNDNSVHRALEHGALACLSKPFNIREVRRWLC